MRKILFDLEKEEHFISFAYRTSMDMSEDNELERGHVLLLVDAGLVAAIDHDADVVRLTNSGHDFIAAVRQDTVWQRTKETAANAGSVTLSVLFDIAVAIGKEKLKQATGINLT